MIQLSVVFVIWIVANIAGGDASEDFDIHIGQGTSDYEFLYDDRHVTLVTIHEQACYFSRVWPRLSDSVLHGELQEMIKFVINSEAHDRTRQTSPEEIRDNFGNGQPDSKCLSKDLYFLHLDYVECDFKQQTFCAWSVSHDGTLQWRFNKGETPTLLTGPDADHTLGTANEGEYIYLEANDGHQGEVAELMSTELQLSSHDILCLRFWYNMYGSDTGQLEVIARPSDSSLRPDNVHLWKQEGNQGHGWKEAQLAVRASVTWSRHPFRVFIRATRGAGTAGDIAIDDVSSIPGPCPVSVLDCSFDSPRGWMCYWSQVNVLDQMSWLRNHGSTHTHGTGPNQGFNATDNYLYLEGNNGHPGDTADLQSPILHLSGPLCLSFSYFMYGSGVGALDVVLLDRSRMLETVLWSQAGDQGYGWIVAHVPVTYSDVDLPVQILFRATRGTSDQSDIAIDNIVSQSGSCQQYIAGTPVIG